MDDLSDLFNKFIISVNNILKRLSLSLNLLQSTNFEKSFQILSNVKSISSSVFDCIIAIRFSIISCIIGELNV